MDVLSIDLKCFCLKVIKNRNKLLTKICYSDAKNSGGEDNGKS